MTESNAVDARLIPTYTVPEAAHYLRMSPATLGAWARGTTYSSGGEKKRFRPVLKLPEKAGGLLSFVNLVEAHVLYALRRKHRVQLPTVRKALTFLKKQFDQDNPLAYESFQTNGIDLFVDRYGQLINASRSGQTEMREMISFHLARVQHDKGGLARRLFPFVRSGLADQPTPVVIDPRISFGRPVISNTGVPTVVVAQRYKAGESIAELGKDYECPGELIEEAVRCELELDAA